jgi:hypothetical protein
VLTSQLSILLATVASDVIPENKEQEYDTLISCSTFGEVFIDSHLLR